MICVVLSTASTPPLKLNMENNNQAKVFQLCKELEDMRKRKKDYVAAYNDEIKRIQGEIRDLLDPESAVELP